MQAADFEGGLASLRQAEANYSKAEKLGGTHEFAMIPDYSGKYAIQPDHSSIHLTFENGIHAPRDFSGDGFFWIDKNKLVLKNVWLGTYKAKQKPDICELTFTRKSG